MTKRTMTTVEHFKWSLTKGEWVPSDKTVTTHEETDDQRWYPQPRPWPMYRSGMETWTQPLAFNDEGRFQTALDGKGEQ